MNIVRSAYCDTKWHFLTIEKWGQPARAFCPQCWETIIVLYGPTCPQCWETIKGPWGCFCPINISKSKSYIEYINDFFCVFNILHSLYDDFIHVASTWLTSWCSLHDFPCYISKSKSHIEYINDFLCVFNILHSLYDDSIHVVDFMTIFTIFYTLYMVLFTWICMLYTTYILIYTI